MPNRREILIGGVAAGALAAAPGVLRAAAHATVVREVAAPYRVVVDERHAAARALADAARARGWPVSTIRGDVTALWYGELALRWREGPAPIVGMTSASALFCLERLAWDAFMRLNLRIDHRGQRDGRVEHRLEAQPGLVAPGELAALARADFAAALPPLLARATRARRGRPATRTLAGAAGTLAPAPEEWLVSWSIGTRAPSAA